MKLNKSLKHSNDNGDFSLYIPFVFNDVQLLFYMEVTYPIYFVTILPGTQHIPDEVSDIPIPFVLDNIAMNKLIGTMELNYSITLESSSGTTMQIIANHTDETIHTPRFVHENTWISVNKSYFF